MEIYLAIKTFGLKINYSLQKQVKDFFKEYKMPLLFSYQKDGKIQPNKSLFSISRSKFADGSDVYITDTDKLDAKNVDYFSGKFERNLVRYFELLLSASVNYPNALKFDGHTIPPFVITFGTFERGTQIIVDFAMSEIRKYSISLLPTRIGKGSCVVKYGKDDVEKGGKE